MKKIFTLSLAVMLSALISAFSNEEPLGDPNKKKINISSTLPPVPRLLDVTTPEAEYNTVTEELTITLDPVYYSEYTITLVSGLIEVDYYPFSPLVCLPTASMGDVVTIYIESDDCGSWYGEIDKAEFGGPISN